MGSAASGRAQTSQLPVYCHHAGGSRGVGSTLLLKLHELMRAEDKLAEHTQRLEQADEQLRQLAPIAKQYQK